MQWLVTLILNWLWGKLAEVIGKLIAQLRRKKEIEKEAEASVEPLKKAETAKEIDDAADDALSGF